jgi:lysophospholipase L1-like esterase
MARAGGEGSALWRRLLPAVAVCAAPLLLFALAELVFRAVWTPPPEFVTWRFQAALNGARWEFLHARRTQLAFECKTGRPFADGVSRAEADAPPFDRVMTRVRVQTNQFGFRDRAFAARKAPGTRRILVLGDSSGFGKGVEEPARFSSVLRAALPPAVEVYNLALPGCTTRDIAALFERFHVLAPDLVIFQAPGNDLDQQLWHLAGGQEPSWLQRTAAALVRRSLLLQRAAYGLHGDDHEAQLDAAAARCADAYRADLDRIFALSAAGGAPVAVVTLARADGRPYGGHVADACRARPDVCLGVLEVELADWQRWLPDVLPPAAGPDPLGWPWLEESAAALSVDRDTLTRALPYHALFHDIIHPNARGHLLIGRQLVAWLRARWEGWPGAGAPAAPP